MPQIDTQTYDKAAHYAVGRGYELRVKPVTSIVVHSTSNPTHKDTAFSAEARFLYEAPLVSAHYLVGKDGATVRFLDPRLYVAWHAGNARADWANSKSIGIELHHSVGDPPYPQAQIAALAALLADLRAQFNIPLGMVETHGQIAIAGPYQRKTDPSDWPHADFIRWRNTLVQDAPPSPTKRYRVKYRYITQRKEDNGPPIVRELVPGEELTVDAWYANNRVHLADGSGFADLADLEQI